MNGSDRTGIACFISSHGFGHAARACAVMEALHDSDARIHFDIYTRVPRWFFEGSLKGSFSFHSLLTDVGVIQSDALTEDLGKTVHHLDLFYPLDPDLVGRLAQELRQRDVRAVLCDIAPMGIAVAHEAGVPSVLIENFTWDWIYAGYTHLDRRMGKHIDYLAGLFASADHHIQTEPVCSPCAADMVTYPFSRRQRHSREEIRQLFGIRTDERTVIVTMGGIQENHSFLDRLKQHRDIRFLVPGATHDLVIEDNLALIPYHPDYYHPDLVRASDAAVGKVGYGTIAEVYDAGIPFGFIPRKASRESGPLTDFVHREMPGYPIPEDEFRSGEWTARLDALLDMPREQRGEDDSARNIAEFILARKA